MNLSQLLHSGSEVLKLKKIETYQLDSELVLSSLLEKKRENLLISLNEKVTKNTCALGDEPGSSKLKCENTKFGV